MAAGDQKLSYAVTNALTVTLASLATDANLLTGRESTAVDNSTNLYLDFLLSGKVTTGTSPTTDKEIRVYVYAQVDDTPVYPDVFDGTDSAETVTDVLIRDAGLVLAAVMKVDATSDQTYWFGPLSIAAMFGGMCPERWGVFITHDTAVNLNATGGNHAIWETGIFATVAQ